jgi:DNA-binding response OmpR family regulator
VPYVVIIEDEPVLAALLAHHFTKEGFVAALAADGQAGLRFVHRYAPVLILLNLLLPRMTGWDVVRTLKADQATREIPIIVLSAISSLDDRIRLLAEQGVDDFIVKPCGVGEVMARSRAVLRRAGRVRDIGAGRDS